MTSYLKFESDIAKLVQNEHRKQCSFLILVKKDSYLSPLKDAFNKAEVEKDAEVLKQLCKIVQILVSAAESKLLDVLMSDQYYLFVFGALEYDPDSRSQSDISHRRFLTETANFKATVQIQEQEVLELIHINFRLIYLRDCGLASVLDDRSLQIMNMTVQSHYIEILRHVQKSKEIVESLLANLKDENQSYNSLRMLHEICTVLKNIPDVNLINKEHIYEILEEFKLFELLEEILYQSVTASTPISTLPPHLEQSNSSTASTGSSSSSTIIPKEPEQKMSYPSIALALEIMNMSLAHAPYLLKNYVVDLKQRNANYPLLAHVSNQITTCSDSSIQLLYGDLLRNLLQDEFSSLNDIHRVFYETLLPQMLGIFKQNQKSCSQGKTIVIESLALGLRNESVRTGLEDYFINTSCLEQIFDCLYQSDKAVIVGVLKLFKLLILSKKTKILNYCTTILDSIIKYLKEKRFVLRKNLIYSVIMEIFEVIRKNDIAILIDHLNANQSDFLSDESIGTTQAGLIRRNVSQFTNETAPNEESDIFDSPLMLMGGNLASGLFKEDSSVGRNSKMGNGGMKGESRMTFSMGLINSLTNKPRERDLLGKRSFSNAFKNDLRSSRLVDYDDDDEEDRGNLEDRKDQDIQSGSEIVDKDEEVDLDLEFDLPMSNDKTILNAVILKEKKSFESKDESGEDILQKKLKKQAQQRNVE
eukprot:TRINITY_DN2812_c0_g1_i3.p1 TRINITY_DN2812_c0_g1~~TRINITY_DN2812_c0_g1_i3.p1  ORF type:complete len:702 (+),score=91.85 TRINITY_DN2812_c0_g1_i3:221-2326(+)